MVMPKDTASRLSGVPGKVNSVVIKAKEEMKFDLLDRISSEMKGGYEVEESLSLQELQESTAQITALFNIMLILVIFISIFIIYTSFKVIMMERIPIIGTFRSVGATKRSTNIIMLGESLFYGVTGGIIGSALGIGILFGMTSVMAYNPYSGTSTSFEMQFGPGHMIAAMLFAVVLSVISSMIPILQVSKISVKDIVLNKIEPTKKDRPYKKYIGLVMLVIFGILPPITPIAKGNMPINVISMTFAIIGLVLTVPPLIIKGFIRIFEVLFGKTFGNEGAFAVKNIRGGNKNVVNNIVLLTIGISSFL